MPRGDGKGTAQVQLTAKAFLSSSTRCDVDAACSACGTDAVDANGLLQCCSDALGASRKHLKHGLDALHQADFLARVSTRSDVHATLGELEDRWVEVRDGFGKALSIAKSSCLGANAGTKLRLNTTPRTQRLGT